MGFTDLRFPLFAAGLLFLYYRVPQKFQWHLLLAASCGFLLWSGWNMLFFLLFTTLTTFAATVWMDRTIAVQGQKAARAKNRLPLTACLVLNFGVLALCKAGASFQKAGLPLGISFYMFQSMGYAIDVYRGTVKAERNILRLTLFAAFFPQLVQGPISKYGQLAPQLFSGHPYDRRQVSFGLQRMLWGYFKKLVVADRIAVAVNALKTAESAGPAFFLLSLFYAVQIYSDFTGGIDIALGLSQALGIPLTENFRHPFFSKNIAEYWRRWHISLGVWMKDYVFYPVSVSAPIRRLSRFSRNFLGTFGKRLPVYLATAVTWFLTGIWHGLTANFVVWGMLNCFFLLLSQELSPLYRKFHSRFSWKEKLWYGGFEILRMFLLMNLIRVCDLFPNVSAYFRGLGSLFTVFSLSISLADLGLAALDWGILAAGTALMLAVSLFQERKGSIRQLLWNRPRLRFALIFILFLVVLLMGRYGIAYDAASFIYNQF